MAGGAVRRSERLSVYFRRSWSPVRWLGRAFRIPGEERLELVQSAKAALAAMLAWLAADHLFLLPQPFLAPWTAVFIVEATVYRSVRVSLQQLATVGAAVLLATAAEQLVPWRVVGLGLVVLVGLLVGRWRLFGANGAWVGITAMLVLTMGTANDGGLLLDRLVETALGASIAIAVNSLLFPPVYGRRAREATKSLAGELADVLGDMAVVVCDQRPGDRVAPWVSKARGAESLVRKAENAIHWSRESRRMNPFRGRAGLVEPGESDEELLATLRTVWPSIQEIAEAVGSTAGEDGSFAYPEREARRTFAELLDGMADAVRAMGEHGRAGTDFDTAVRRCRVLTDELDDRVHSTSPDAVAQAVGLASMLLPARHALRELTG